MLSQRGRRIVCVNLEEGLNMVNLSTYVTDYMQTTAMGKGLRMLTTSPNTGADNWLVGGNWLVAVGW